VPLHRIWIVIQLTQRLSVAVPNVPFITIASDSKRHLCENRSNPLNPPSTGLFLFRDRRTKRVFRLLVCSEISER
jgi:hypothetical protein